MRTFAGWVYAAFILDMCTRMIVGWQLSTSLHTRLALDALDMAIWSRRRQDRDLSALIHHSDKCILRSVRAGVPLWGEPVFRWAVSHGDGARWTVAALGLSCGTFVAPCRWGTA